MSQIIRERYLLSLNSSHGFLTLSASMDLVSIIGLRNGLGAGHDPAERHRWVEMSSRNRRKREDDGHKSETGGARVLEEFETNVVRTQALRGDAGTDNGDEE